MRIASFQVPGKPQGKARARTYHNKALGHSVTYTPEKDMLYENFIKNQYLNACTNIFFEKGTPVSMQIVARFVPPKSVSKKRTQQMLEGKELPLKKPDVDNIVKVVADALNGVAYHDDTQIASVTAKKVYSALEGLDVRITEYLV